MIEVAIRQYLADNLEDIAVVMEQPKNPPKEYILLRLVDSGRTNHIGIGPYVGITLRNSDHISNLLSIHFHRLSYIIR